MRKLNILIVLIAFSISSANTLAGKSMIKSTTTYRPSTVQSKSNLSNKASHSQKSVRRSLLSGSSIPPPKVAQIIREKESKFGVGLMSGAILMYLLSSHEISSKDKQWVQGKLDGLKANGESIDDGLIRITPLVVNFSYIGLKPQYSIGENINITASAMDGPNPTLIACSMNNATITLRNTSTHISWISNAPAAVILTCESNGHKDYRIIHVA